MAEGTSRIANSIKEDYLTCSICCDTFKSPRILPCGHSFCFRCLEDYAKSKCSKAQMILPCPICRQPYTIEQAGDGSEGLQQWLEGLSSDTLSLSVMQVIESFVPLPKSSEVLIVNKGSNQSNHASTDCPQHPSMKLEVFCSKHDVVICPECAWREHGQDACLCYSVGDVIQRRLSAVKELVAKQNSDAICFLESNETGVHSLPNMRRKLHQDMTQIEESFQRMCTMFSQRMMEAHTEINNALESHQDIVTLKRQQNALNTQIELLENQNTEDPRNVLRDISLVWNKTSEFQRCLHEISMKTSIPMFSKTLEADIKILKSVGERAIQCMESEDVCLTSDDTHEANIEDNYVIVGNTMPASVEDGGVCLGKYHQYDFSVKRPGEGRCMLSGVALIGNASLVVVDQTNSKLKKFKIPEGYFQCEYRLKSEPNQITSLKESNLVAVTLWDLRQIYVMATDPVLVLRTVICTETEYIGITSPMPNYIVASSIRKKQLDLIQLDDSLCNATEESVEPQYSLKSDMVRSVFKSSFPDRIDSTAEGHVVVKNRKTKDIVCVNKDNNGRFLWSRRLPATAMDVTCCLGRLFATLGSRNEVVYFPASGIGRLETLKAKTTVNRPWCITGFKDCVVVTEDSPSDRVHVFVFDSVR